MRLNDRAGGSTHLSPLLRGAATSAVILAAGYGSRIAALGRPKPLVEVAGRSLLEWSIRQAAAAGIGHFVVVTGHQAEQVEAQLGLLAARYSVPVEACRLSDWTRPNGYSVMAGAARVQGNYLLIMADHIFSAEVLQRLMAAPMQSRGALLAIDRDVSGPMVDPDDATFVTLMGDRISTIGKQLDSFDAVDCGAFVATPDLAAAIGSAIAEGRAGSLSDGMQWLADRGLAGTIDVTGEWWIDVDDPQMHRLAQAGVALHLQPAAELENASRAGWAAA
jgi:1L-myo-inositol 1-phosphate cytidylyltransferase